MREKEVSMSIGRVPTFAIGVALVGGAFMLGESAHAVTIVVHHDGTGQQPTILAAMGAAADGDTILLAPGTYTGPANRDVDFGGRDVVVTSQDGPVTTIIDCEQSGRAFWIHASETSAAVVSELTIENGLIAIGNGGAILCQGASPTIEGNIIRSCQATQGGAIACLSGSDPIIRNNVIDQNTAYQGLPRNGGAIFMSGGSSPIIDMNTLTGNSGSNGGAIYNTGYSTPQITDNLIQGNIAHAVGGGIWIYQGAPVITGNLIVENDASTAGGIHIDAVVGATQMENNTIAANNAVISSGVEISMSGTVSRNIIAFNTGQGGAIGCLAVPPTWDCCLVYGNAGDESVCGTTIDLVADDPLFCGPGDYTIRSDSPASAASSPCAALIGAYPVSCDPTPTTLTTWGRIKAGHR